MPLLLADYRQPATHDPRVIVHSPYSSLDAPSQARVAPDPCLCDVAPPKFALPPPPEPYAFIPEVSANQSRAELVDCDLGGIRGLVLSFEKYSPHADWTLDQSGYGGYYERGRSLGEDGQPRERVEDVINEFILEHWTKLALATAIGVCLFASCLTCILFYYNRKFGAKAKTKAPRSQSETKIIAESASTHSAFRNAADWAYVRPPGGNTSEVDTVTRRSRSSSRYQRTSSMPSEQFYAASAHPYSSIRDGPTASSERGTHQQPLLQSRTFETLDPGSQHDSDAAESVYQTLSHYRPSFSSFRGGLDNPEELDPPSPDIGPTPVKGPLVGPDGRNLSRYDDIASTAGYNGGTLMTNLGRHSGVYDTMQSSLSMLHQLQQLPQQQSHQHQHDLSYRPRQDDQSYKPRQDDPSYGIYNEDRSCRSFPKIFRQPSAHEKLYPPPVAAKPSNYYHKDSPGFKAMKERALASTTMQFPPPPPDLASSTGYVNDPTLPYQPGIGNIPSQDLRVHRNPSIHSLPRRQMDQHQLEPLVNEVGWPANEHDQDNSDNVHIPLRAFELNDDII